MITSINLKVTNNTSDALPVSILGVIPPNTPNNIKESYVFDMSGEIIIPKFNYQYQTIESATLISLSFDDNIPTLQGYVDTLNSQNVGLFVLNGTTITMFSDFYIGRVIKI